MNRSPGTPDAESMDRRVQGSTKENWRNVISDQTVLIFAAIWKDLVVDTWRSGSDNPSKVAGARIAVNQR